ncbi:MAG: ParA family protein [Rhodomicrobiaceae bacterium]
MIEWLSNLNLPIIGTLKHQGVDVVASLIAAVLIAAIAYLITKLWRLMMWVKLYFERVDKAKADVKRKQINGIETEGDGVWTAKPIIHPDHYLTTVNGSKILAVANLKGGVGKTTISANLASCLAEMLNKHAGEGQEKPVLLIDLDFQGTLAGMAKPNKRIWPPKKHHSSHATKLISGELTPHHLIDLHFPANERELVEIIPAYYELAQAENRLMVEWLLSDRKKDVRYTLAEVLHHPLVQEKYSLIIIDCPPRLTTAAIQALCASTHLLIPTILDGASANAVSSFVNQVENLREADICPHIKHIGVVGSMLIPGQSYDNIYLKLEDLLNTSREAGGSGNVTSVINKDIFIPRYRAIANAASEGIIYPIKDDDGTIAQNINSSFENLSLHVKDRMGLQSS